MMRSVPEEDLPVALGEVVDGKYRLDRIIGRGGMGFVVQATRVDIQQRVAIKFLSSEALREEDARTRFLREARAAAALASEHVARVLDMGVLANGVPYLAIEYLDGEDLAMRLRRGPLAPHEAIDLLAQACDALGEAHRLGIVHRDVKPHNMFLVRRSNGTTLLKVLDFGIAKMSDANAFGPQGITGTCVVMGTPQYMAPEQMASTRSVDARADVWALGVCLYECLTKRRPFEASNMLELGAMVMTGAPTPVATHRTDLPRPIVEVIERCLQKDPLWRFANADELGTALNDLANGRAVSLAPAPVVAPSPAWPAHLQTVTSSGGPGARSRSSLLLAIVAVAVGGLVVGAGVRFAVKKRAGAETTVTAGTTTVQGPLPSATTDVPGVTTTSPGASSVLPSGATTPTTPATTTSATITVGTRRTTGTAGRTTRATPSAPIVPATAAPDER